MADRVHQMGLAQADAAVQVKRVVRAGRGLADGHRGRVGELVRRADHERFERVAGVQTTGRRVRGRGGDLPRHGSRVALRAPDPGCRGGGWGGALPGRVAPHGGFQLLVDDELQADAVASNLGHRFRDHLGVVLVQPAAAELAGHPDRHAVAGVLDERGLAEPRVEAVPVDLGFDAGEKLRPDVVRHRRDGCPARGPRGRAGARHTDFCGCPGTVSSGDVSPAARSRTALPDFHRSFHTLWRKVRWMGNHVAAGRGTVLHSGDGDNRKSAPRGRSSEPLNRPRPLTSPRGSRYHVRLVSRGSAGAGRGDDEA